MFKVKQIAYNCEFQNEKITYDIDDLGEVNFIFDGRFVKDLLNNVIVKNEVVLRSILVGNSDITEKFTEEIKKKITRFVLEDIVDITEVNMNEEFDYELEFSNTKQISELLKKEI